MKKSTSLELLIQVSTQLSCNKELIQGPGGNASLKIKDSMWVKASGTWLSRANQESVFVNVSLNGVYNAYLGLNKLSESILGRTPESLNPSMESFFHALMPYRWVLHFHPVNLIALTLCPGAKEKLQVLLQGLEWSWIDYIQPGIPLAKAIDCLNPKPPVIILAKHGILLGKDNYDDLLLLLSDIIKRLKNLDRKQSSFDMSFLEMVSQKTGWLIPNEPILSLGVEIRHIKALKSGYLFPDQVVFLYKKDLIVKKKDIKFGNPSILNRKTFLVIEEAGTLINHDISENEKATLEALAMIVKKIPEGKEPQPLSEPECLEIRDCKMEKARTNVNFK